MTQVHPALAGGDDSGIPWHPHDGEDLTGLATFLQVNVENLLAGTIDSKEIVISGGTDGVIKSDNYEAGVSGWAIFGDGSIEARNITIVAGAGSEVDWSFIQNVSIDNADINSLSFDKITAATNTASLVIGSGGSIESANFSAGSAGFQITGAGDIEANDITARGALISQAGSQIDASHLTVGTLDADRIDVLGDVTLGGQLSASGVRVGQKVNASQTSEWRGIGVEWSGATTVTALMRDVNAGRTLFRVNHGGAASISFDSDAATPLTIKGLITASEIEASEFRTASSGERLDIDPGVDALSVRFFDSGGTQRGSLHLSTTDTVMAVAGANGWGAKINSSGSEVEAEGTTAHMLGDSGAMLIEASPAGGKLQSPSGSVAVTAYRQTGTSSNDIAHFRSNVGGTDTLNALVQADGDLQNTNNSYGGISDERLKENIETARDYLEDLRKVRITKHTLKSTGKKLLGPIAQELQLIFPGMVRENEDGYLSVKHSVFVPMAITAIQELADDRDEMKDRLDRMESRLAELEAA